MTTGYYQAVRLTPMQRLWRKLGFGTRRAPDHTLEQTLRMAGGEVTSRTTIRLDWRDRLRVIVSGHLVLETRTITDVPVRSAKTTSAIGVMPPGT